MYRTTLLLSLTVLLLATILSACTVAAPAITDAPVMPLPVQDTPIPVASSPTTTTESQTAASPTPTSDLIVAAAPSLVVTEITFVCPQPVSLTLAQTEGPFYTTDTPEKTSFLEDGIPGVRLLLTGYVLSPDCEPIPGAWLDFWQTDGEGAYDNAGYRLRGHQYTDEMGRYMLETVYPGEYPGRTPHIHVKVMAPGGTMLTTQVYFPGESRNTTDGIFRSELLAEMEPAEDGWSARFDFYIPLP